MFLDSTGMKCFARVISQCLAAHLYKTCLFQKKFKECRNSVVLDTLIDLIISLNTRPILWLLIDKVIPSPSKYRHPPLNLPLVSHTTTRTLHEFSRTKNKNWYSYNLKMEEVFPSELLVPVYQITWL